MRCPKCGYITFDHLETCTKCSKNIAAVSQQLSGTVDKAESPSFLHFKVHELETDNDVSVELLPEDDDIDLDITADGDDGVDVDLLLVEKDMLESDETQAYEDLDLESDEIKAVEDLDLDFIDESVEALGLGSNEEDASDLAFSEEESIGFDLDDEETDASYDEDGPPIDFSELDISDLAPPEADEHDLSSGELTIEGVEDEPVATAVDAAQASMKKSGAGLEDLKMDGLGLEIPSLPPAGSATEKKLMTTVKTGTALDEFDIDLGELISDMEK